MAILSQQQIENWWNSQTGDPAHARIASAVALASSGGDSGKITPVPGSSDYLIGLWQFSAYQVVNDPRLQLFGPPDFLAGHIGDQCLAAQNFSSGGTDWTPWPAFNDGSYLAFMAGPPAPAPPTPVYTFGQSISDQWLEGMWQIMANWAEVFAPAVSAELTNILNALDSIG